MPQTNNIITPKERLMIAATLLAAAIPTNEYYATPYGAKDALIDTDTLVAESGCIVEGEVVLEHEMD